MNNSTVFSRISGWFKPGSDDGAVELPLENERATLTQTAGQQETVSVTTFLKPWAKRDAALVQLQDGFTALTALMGAVKENLDRQAQRQDELLQVLQHLPAALRAIPENSRMQTETLRAVGEQLQRHNVHYHRLADVLEKVSDSASDQRTILEALHERVDTISQHDRSMADNMRSVSSAMQGVSQNTQASAQVLDQMKTDMGARDHEMKLRMRRHNLRITTMIAVAMVLSLSAIAAVGLIAWKFLR